MNKQGIILPVFTLLFSLTIDCFSQAPNSFPSVAKQFNPAGMALEPFCMASDKANGYLLAGDTYPPERNTFLGKTTCLIRVDENGCVTWAKSMNTGEEEVIQAMIPTSDSGFLISAFPFQSQTANYPNSLIILKLNKQGDLEWAHDYNSVTSVNNYFSALLETTDKGFAVEIGSFPGSGPSFLSILKLDRLGGLTWGHKLGMEDNALYNIGGITETNGALYTTGSIYENTAPFRLLRSFVTQLDRATGFPAWTRQNNPAQSPLSFTDVHAYKQGLLINSFNGNALSELITTDYNGNSTGANLVNNPYGASRGGENILVTSGNELYFHQPSGSAAGPRKDILMRLDSDQQILWQYDLSSQDHSFDGWYQLSAAPLKGVAAIGSGVTSKGLNTLTFLRLDSTGTTCISGDAHLSISPIACSLIPLVWVTNTSLSMNVTDLPQPLHPLSMGALTLCPGSASACDSLKLEGPATICQLTEPARYLLHTDPACTEPVTWNYDPLHISVVASSAGEMEFHFKEKGVYTIKVEKQTLCTMLADSIIVTVADGSSGVHLPEDTVLCSGKTLLLDAGAGYNRYRWQDGSTGESLRISAAGAYSVQLTDKNGCAGTDKILVTEKKCPYDLIFPNAFTPNSDGHNDLFRPMTTRRPHSYHLSIYTRWGQRIFYTTDPGKGWDGRIEGHDQASGTYIWACDYQFDEEKKQNIKGHFTLIR